MTTNWPVGDGCLLGIALSLALWVILLWAIRSYLAP
jgi:predicted Kef-type K+ transport protein